MEVDAGGLMGVRVLFMGMRGAFSRWVLQQLLNAGVEMCSVIVPADQTDHGGAWSALTAPEPVSKLPMARRFVSYDVVHMAWERGIPAFEMGSARYLESAAAMSALAPDVACVACFPMIIPESMLAIPRHAFLNVHPSMLPAYRGPEPLFWIFRDGVQRSGVTVHLLDRSLDSGDVVAQQEVFFPDGMSGAEAEELCAVTGGRLLADALRQIAKGKFSHQPQQKGGSYQGRPAAADFRLDTSWPAGRAYNFMRGTAEWGRSYSLEIGGDRIWLKSAVAFDARSAQRTPMVRHDQLVRIRFSPGVLEAVPA